MHFRISVEISEWELVWGLTSSGSKPSTRIRALKRETLVLSYRP